MHRWVSGYLGMMVRLMMGLDVVMEDSGSEVVIEFVYSWNFPGGWSFVEQCCRWSWRQRDGKCDCDLCLVDSWIGHLYYLKLPSSTRHPTTAAGFGDGAQRGLDVVRDSPIVGDEELRNSYPRCCDAGWFLRGLAVDSRTGSYLQNGVYMWRLVENSNSL